MLKRKPLLFFMVIAFVALFAVTEALAQVDICADDPLNCCYTEGNKYKVEIAPNADGLWPYPDPINGGYTYSYDVTAGDTSKITQFNVSLIYTDKESVNVIAGPPSIDINEPCEGADNSTYGLHVCSTRVVTLPLETNPGGSAPSRTWFNADNAEKTEMGLLIRTAKFDYGCKIYGPGIAISAAVPASNVVVDTPDGDYVIVKKNRKTGCIEEFVDKNGAPIGWQYGNPPFIKDTDEPIDCGGLENRNCRGCFVNAPGRSLYYWDPILKKYVCYYGC